MTAETQYVAVDPRTLSVEGIDGGVDALPNDAVIHLAEPALGMKAGYWCTRWRQGRPGTPGAARILQFAGERASGSRAGDAHAARVCALWAEPYPTAVSGWRLSDLRALIEEHADLPDATLVLIGPSDHPADGRWSPVGSATTGRSAPNTDGGGNYGQFWSDDCADDEADPIPSDTLPALALIPSA